jgi:SAM-dependent methyltransferase
MAQHQIRFEDGAAYERMMGSWSRLVGEVFLDWLAPRPGLRWIDVGCGSGAFTERLIERCAPAEVQAIDPSEGQLAFARQRPAARGAEFRQGDAMALPFPNGKFDAAVMALVIFFVPDPARGVAEMARVVTKGGIVATYVWDITGGGSPSEPILSEMRPGLHAPEPAELWRIADGRPAGFVGRCGPGGDRDARDHGVPDVRGFRRFLDDQSDVAQRRSDRCRNVC